MKYVASCSFGKDSLAMVLLLIEKEYPLDEVIFYDTEMEFQAIYGNKTKMEKILTERKIKFTVLRDSLSFLYRAFEVEIHTRSGLIKKGNDWCGRGNVRWGTNGKLSSINKHYKETYPDDVIVEYVGVAADETHRISKYRSKRSRKTVKVYPLVEWGMKEQDCLDYCYENGWDWKENNVDLYDILDRVSCWCCGFKNQKEIKNIMTYLPEYWDRIREYESRCSVPYKGKGCEYFEKKLKSDWK